MRFVDFGSSVSYFDRPVLSSALFISFAILILPYFISHSDTLFSTLIPSSSLNPHSTYTPHSLLPILTHQQPTQSNADDNHSPAYCPSLRRPKYRICPRPWADRCAAR